MIKIGDFSKLAHVTVKTLHHYGELGLLKPTHIDRYSGYRYYSLEQLPRLNRILALKDLGFTLDQVGQLVDDNLSVAEMRGMLRMKQIELSEKLEVEQARLAQVEVRLQHLERAGVPPVYEVALKQVEAQTALTARAVAASEQAIQPALQSLQALLQQNMVRARLKSAGPLFQLKEDLPYRETHLEVALAVPVVLRSGQRAGDWEGSDSPVRLDEIMAVDCMASVIHAEKDASIDQAYAGLYAWAQANAFQIGGPCREVYLPQDGIKASSSSPAQTGFVEVQCPVERVRVPLSLRIQTRDQKDDFMEPKFVTKPAMTVIGMAYIGNNTDQGPEFNHEIAAMWDEFNQRDGEVKALVERNSLGACFSNFDGAAEGEFEYVACYSVEPGTQVPEGMAMRQIPEYKYAVFTHKGKPHNLGETYRYIYETWLPQSGVELHADKFDMELYDQRFIPNSDESEFDILVAVK
jgi:predicted transcriptional regulator YdeE/DNA-binding transcriptional MerR regulator